VQPGKPAERPAPAPAAGSAAAAAAKQEPVPNGGAAPQPGAAPSPVPAAAAVAPGPAAGAAPAPEAEQGKPGPAAQAASASTTSEPVVQDQALVGLLQVPRPAPGALLRVKLAGERSAASCAGAAGRPPGGLAASAPACPARADGAGAQVLASELLNARATPALRAVADMCLQARPAGGAPPRRGASADAPRPLGCSTPQAGLRRPCRRRPALTPRARVPQRVVKATGQPAAQLLAPTLAKAAPSLERRRLMPLRHLGMQTGNAAAITYCIQQRPPLLPLTQARPALASAAPALPRREGARGPPPAWKGRRRTCQGAAACPDEGVSRARA